MILKGGLSRCLNTHNQRPVTTGARAQALRYLHQEHGPYDQTRHERHHRHELEEAVGRSEILTWSE